MQAARKFQRTDHFRSRYRERVVVEHRIARLVQIGLRKARYFGKAKTLFQLAMTAAVANLSLIASNATKALSLLNAVTNPFKVMIQLLLRRSHLALQQRAWTGSGLVSLNTIALIDRHRTPTFRLCL